MIAIFNIPAIIALLLCLSQTRTASLETQKNIKLCLKVGIAKSLGGVLLAAFMIARFASFGDVQDEEQYGVSVFMKRLVSYVTMAAIVDIIYSIAAYFLIKSTRAIKKAIVKSQKAQEKTLDFAKEKVTINLENVTVSPRQRSP